VGPQLPVHPRQERLGRSDGLRIEREVGRDPVEGRERGLASGAPGDVPLEQAIGFLRVGSGQRAERVAREQFLDRLVIRHSVSSSAFLSLRIAANVLVFTVPRGIPISSAICTCVFPPK
jgi:hypothetical protein